MKIKSCMAKPTKKFLPQYFIYLSQKSDPPPPSLPFSFQPCSLRNYVPRLEMNLKSFKTDVRDMSFRKPKKDYSKFILEI